MAAANCLSCKNMIDNRLARTSENSNSYISIPSLRIQVRKVLLHWYHLSSALNNWLTLTGNLSWLYTSDTNKLWPNFFLVFMIRTIAASILSRAQMKNKLMSKGHVTRGNFPCNLQRNGVALQVARKTSSCDTPCLQLVSQRKIALQVAEKVEAASTFRNVTWQVAACDTPTATCLAIFWEGTNHNT